MNKIGETEILGASDMKIVGRLENLIRELNEENIHYKTPYIAKKMVADDLENIIKTFNDCMHERKKFAKLFPRWKQVRLENIKFLETMADDLDEYRKNFNISRIVGSSVGIVGGVATTIGVVLTPFTFGLSAPLILGGAAIGVAGGASNVGTAIIETVLIKEKLTKSKELLEKDLEDFEELGQWFEHSQKFIDAVEQVMSFNALKKILDCIRDLIFDIHGPNADISSADCTKMLLIFEEIISKLLSCAINFASVFNMLNLLHTILVDPVAFRLFKILTNLHKDNILVFESIMLTTKFILQVGRLTDAGVDATMAILTVLKNGATITQSAGRIVAHTLLTSVGVALDVTNIVLSSIDLQEGSKCTSGEQIRKVIIKMQEETDNLSSILVE